jgi:glycosyltransferase involved in cell wall biosynthesis
VRAEGIVTAPQLEALETSMRTTFAPNLETLMASELETIETRIQRLTDEVHSLRTLIRYLLLSDSDSTQQLVRKSDADLALMPEILSQASLPSSRRSTDQRLKILHIGNIANNAYHLAKILNEAGLACDVLCYNYYHVMGSPEWEDADFIGSVDEWTPEWDSMDLQGFQRPLWFAQGPLHICANYLYARRQRRIFEAANLWPELTFKFASVPSTKPMVLHPSPEPCLSDADCQGLIQTFAQAFPERGDKLQQADLDKLQFYTRHVGLFKSLFAEYDIVQGYATDPIWSLLAGQRPYVAFEHGTIRQIPFDDDPIGRLTALAYHQADGVIITNGDNNHAAERLKLTNYRFIPHAVNEKWLQPGLGRDLREQLRQELDTDFVVFHPARQHWEAQRDLNWEKGNDIFIEGLARFIREVAPRAAAVFVEWGKKVAESKALLEQLGIARQVQWIPLQHNCGLSRYVDACDIVADQFYIGAFGNIMPKALAHGKPAILYVDEARHRWCFPEMPPVINARTPDEVYRGLTRAYRDRGWLQELAEAGLRWYRTYHSNAVIRERLMTLYRDVLVRYSKQL